MGELYIVGTPIGNLEDITLRALETLKKVDYIACEDTRQTLKLLSHYNIHKPLVSCHANDELKASRKIVSLLAGGASVAYCSDAGTPGLSDPGAVLAREVRREGYRVVPIPGPSAFAALISVAGFGGRSVLFDGFPSPKASRRKTRLAELLAREEAFVLYESPYRIAKLMRELALLAPEREVCIGREMTKLHEDIRTGTACELAALFEAESSGTSLQESPIPARGEFAILVSGRENQAGPPKDECSQGLD